MFSEEALGDAASVLGASRASTSGETRRGRRDIGAGSHRHAGRCLGAGPFHRVGADGKGSQSAHSPQASADAFPVVGDTWDRSEPIDAERLTELWEVGCRCGHRCRSRSVWCAAIRPSVCAWCTQRMSRTTVSPPATMTKAIWTVVLMRHRRLALARSLFGMISPRSAVPQALLVPARAGAIEH